MRLFGILLIAGLFSMSFQDCPPQNKENKLLGTLWKSNGVPFEDSERDSYTFTRQADDNQFNWGNFIRFDKENQFSSYYSAPCGNDCFTSVTGRYHYLNDTTISITVNSISYSGFCQKESKDGFQFTAKYEMSIDGDTVYLQKSSK